MPRPVRGVGHALFCCTLSQGSEGHVWFDALFVARWQSAEDNHFFDRRYVMKLRLVLSVLSVVCLLSFRPAFAHEWTDSSGTYKIEAELVKLDGEVVHLKKADGTTAKVPLNKLCEDDRKFVRQQMAARAAVSPKADSEVGPDTSQPASAQPTPSKAATDLPPDKQKQEQLLTAKRKKLEQLQKEQERLQNAPATNGQSTIQRVKAKEAKARRLQQLQSQIDKLQGELDAAEPKTSDGESNQSADAAANRSPSAKLNKSPVAVARRELFGTFTPKETGESFHGRILAERVAKDGHVELDIRPDSGKFTRISASDYKIAIEIQVIDAKGTQENPSREWSDATGQRKINAKLVDFRHGVVCLTKPNDESCFLAVEKLSEPDQLLIRQLDAVEQLTSLGSKLQRDKQGKIDDVSLEGPNVTDATLAYLQYLPDLANVLIKETNVTGRGLVHLRGLSHLYSLSLDGNAIDDQGLAGLEELKQIHALVLHEKNVSDAGLTHVRPLSHLETLMFGGDKDRKQFTDAAIDHLRNLKGLKGLVLANTDINKIQVIMSALPTIELMIEEKDDLQTLWKRSTKDWPEFPGYDMTLRKDEYLGFTKMPNNPGCVTVVRASPDKTRGQVFLCEVDNNKPAYIAQYRFGEKGTSTFTSETLYWPNGQVAYREETDESNERHLCIQDKQGTRVGDIDHDVNGIQKVRKWETERISQLCRESKGLASHVQSVLDTNKKAEESFKRLKRDTLGE